jgi:shikimate kinase
MLRARNIAPVALVALAVAAPAAPASTTASGAAAAREFEGVVVSVNRDRRTFRLRDCERGTVRIKVNRRTRFERIAGMRGLHAGMRNVESVVQRKNGRWVALEVERSGGGGEHGGCDDD